MKKKLLVVGAGEAQLDAIIQAKNLGYEILATDLSHEAPGFAIADKNKNIDVKDIDTTLDWARKEQIDGVISYASDVTLPTVLAIREALNLPGLGRKAVEVSMDKGIQRRLFQKRGLAQPDFIIAEHEENLEAVKNLSFPLVLKPVDNSGSRGVILTKNENDLLLNFHKALNLSSKKKVIIEKYLEGKELTVEGLSIAGEHHILAISDKYKPYHEEYLVSTQLTYPALISPETEDQVIKLIRDAYDVAEVDNTPTHSEVILTENGPKIVEIGCRGGGFFVFSRVVEAVSGYDIVSNWSRFCMGDDIELVKKNIKGVVLRFFVACPGILKKVEGFEKAMKLPGVSGGLFIKPGEKISELATDGSRVGWMIVQSGNRKDALTISEQVVQQVHFQVE